MRHHGQIREDRRGLAAVAGLLLGILGGVAVLASGTAPSPEQGSAALSRPFLEAKRLGLASPPPCPPAARPGG
ncbi:MAG TPA: hypothetical protein VEB20_15600 [Azospirillaceae bacterium]|nr:hypothetical protein [Azospirillaceae bacterium]